MPQTKSTILPAKVLLQLVQQYKDDLGEADLSNIYHNSVAQDLLAILAFVLSTKAARPRKEEADELPVIHQLLTSCAEQLEQAPPTEMEKPSGLAFCGTRKLVDQLIADLR